jgi:hypothetical protein
VMATADDEASSPTTMHAKSNSSLINFVLIIFSL